MRPLCACTHPDGYDAAQLARIAAAHGVPPLLARALVRRGLTDDAAIDAFPVSYTHLTLPTILRV